VNQTLPLLPQLKIVPSLDTNTLCSASEENPLRRFIANFSRVQKKVDEILAQTDWDLFAE
jgi:hypothetical protein